MEKNELQKFIDKNYIYAIVGATQNKNKYGYKVLMDLKNKGYNVVAVNPKYSEIEGVPCYPTVFDLEERPDVVVLVVGEENAKKVVQDCIDSDLNRIWFQPGSEYPAAVKLAKNAGLNIVTKECIMVETNELI